MAEASPGPPGVSRVAEPAGWLPLAFFGAVIAVSVPLYATQPAAPAFSGWLSYGPLTRRGSRPGPGRGYLVTGLLLTAAVTVVPLLLIPRSPLPAWLWLGNQWASGTFALLVIAAAVWTLARYARSRLLAVIALAYTAAIIIADWPTLRAAPPALLVTGGDPLRTLVAMGTRGQSAAAALLPALVLLVAAAVSFTRPAWFRGEPHARRR